METFSTCSQYSCLKSNYENCEISGIGVLKSVKIAVCGMKRVGQVLFLGPIRFYFGKIKCPGIVCFVKSAFFEKKTNNMFLNLNQMCQIFLLFQLGGFALHRHFWIAQVLFCQIQVPFIEAKSPLLRIV